MLPDRVSLWAAGLEDRDALQVREWHVPYSQCSTAVHLYGMAHRDTCSKRGHIAGGLTKVCA